MLLSISLKTSNLLQRKKAKESFEHFLYDVLIDSFLLKRIESGPILIIFDGPQCHGLDFELLANRLTEYKDGGYDIVLYVLPHNTSLSTQPCDVGPFGIHKIVDFFLFFQ